MEIFIKSILWLLVLPVAIRLYNEDQKLPAFNHKMVLGGLAAFYALLGLLGLVLQHLSFNTFAKDQTIYLQALGNWRLFSPILGKSLLAEHFSPVLYLLLPITSILNTPYILFLLQTLLLVLPVFPIFKIAKHFGLKDWPALLMVFLYLNMFYLRNTMQTDFHVEFFMPICFFMLVEAFLNKKTIAFWAWLAASLLIKEDVGFYLAAWFAIIAVAQKDYRKKGLVYAVLCFVAGVVAITLLLPSNNGVYPYFEKWQAFGQGLFGIIFGALFNPLATLGVFFKAAFWKFLLPLAVLPLLTVWGWAAVPALWLQLASGDVIQNNLELYYAAPVIPLMIVALIAGWRKFEKWSGGKSNKRNWTIALVSFLIIFNLHWIPMRQVKKEHFHISKLMAKMPDKGTIFAQANIAPHISNSKRVKVLGMNSINEKPDVIIFHVKGNIWPFNREQYLSAINKIKFNINYKLWKNEAGVQIYVRKRDKRSGKK